MKIPDCYDPVYQAEQREAEWERKLPRCDSCGERITDDYLWDIDGEILCEDCARRMYRKNIENYLE